MRRGESIAYGRSISILRGIAMWQSYAPEDGVLSLSAESLPYPVAGWRKEVPHSCPFGGRHEWGI